MFPQLVQKTATDQTASANERLGGTIAYPVKTTCATLIEAQETQAPAAFPIVSTAQTLVEMDTKAWLGFAAGYPIARTTSVLSETPDQLPQGAGDFPIRPTVASLFSDDEPIRQSGRATPSRELVMRPTAVGRARPKSASHFRRKNHTVRNVATLASNAVLAFITVALLALFQPLLRETAFQDLFARADLFGSGGLQGPISLLPAPLAPVTEIVAAPLAADRVTSAPLDTVETTTASDAPGTTGIGAQPSADFVIPGIAAAARPSPLGPRADKHVAAAAITSLQAGGTVIAEVPHVSHIEIDAGTDPDAMLAEGQRLLRYGDVAGARAMFQRAAQLGSAQAALALGSTYDPHSIAETGLRTVVPDRVTAVGWYRRAHRLAAGKPPEGAADLDQ